MSMCESWRHGSRDRPTSESVIGDCYLCARYLAVTLECSQTNSGRCLAVCVRLYVCVKLVSVSVTAPSSLVVFSFLCTTMQVESAENIVNAMQTQRQTLHAVRAIKTASDRHTHRQKLLLQHTTVQLIETNKHTRVNHLLPSNVNVLSSFSHGRKSRGGDDSP